MIGADHEDRGVLLHRAPRSRQPLAREAVVVGEGGELVPIVVDGVDHALVGTRQRAFELQIIGRVGEDEVGATFR